jgi:hypothetical protein
MDIQLCIIEIIIVMCIFKLSQMKTHGYMRSERWTFAWAAMDKIKIKYSQEPEMEM